MNTLLLIFYWLLVCVAIVFGVAAGLGAILFGAILSEDRTVALLSCALGAILLSWLPSRFIAHKIAARLSPESLYSVRLRLWLPLAASGLSAAIVGLVVYSLFLEPPSRGAAMLPTDQTAYWDLPTGTHIAYTERAPAAGRASYPILLVHGGPGGPDTNPEALLTILSDAGFHVYDYHQTGAGLSGRLTDVTEYTLQRHVDDLEAIRQELGVERVKLVGASWGGQLIVNYLAAHPDRVAKAVIASPGPIWSPAYTDETRLTAEGRRDIDESIGDYPRFLLAHILVQSIGPNATYALLPDEQIDGVFQEFVQNLDMAPGCPGITLDSTVEDDVAERPSGIGFWANTMTTQSTYTVPDPRPALSNVDAQVLILRGECDYIAPQVAQEYVTLLPNAHMQMIEGAGHTIQNHQPDLFYERLVTFLRNESMQ